ncbi:MAG: Mov34/MPN/PAD-1 family protein [Thermoplasmata archaeon]
MRAVVLPSDLLSEMKAHSREAYPDECCGFLIASDRSVEEVRKIDALERARNEFEGERRRRFLIRPEELRDLERCVQGSGRSVVGFYHSHPDHPVRPSEFDREHAWPWYTYLVLSVTAHDVPAVGAFELDPDSSLFREVSLTAAPSMDSPLPVVRR